MSWSDIRFAVILWALAVAAGYFIISALMGMPAIADEYNLERVDHATARFCYYNSAEQNSTAFSDRNPLQQSVDELHIEVIVAVSLEETITVEPPNGWYVDPAKITLADGERACIIIKQIPLG